MAREVGTEGQLGVQAEVKGVAGTWKDLTDSVRTRWPPIWTGQGPQHRGGGDRDRHRRPRQEDHGRRQGRDPGAQDHHQHDGGPAFHLRLGSHARRPRGRHRRQARRCRRRSKAWEAFGRISPTTSISWARTSRPRCATSPRSPLCGCQRRPVAQDHRRRLWGDLRVQENHQHDGRSAEELFRLGGYARGARGRHRGTAWRPRPTSRAWRASWKDLTDSVNGMASNLTAQVRNIAEVTTAVAGGDLSKKITVDVQGEILEAQGHHQHDGRSAARVRLGSHAGRPRGRHRGQARRLQAVVRGIGGTWKDLTDSVNGVWQGRTSTAQVRNIAQVTTAVANGDLGKKITTVDVRGEILELKNTINTMVDQLERLRFRGGRGWRARSATRRQARRPGGGARGGRHLEGPHRQRQLHGVEHHLQPGPQHRRRDHGGRQAGDLTRKITVDVKGEILEAQEHHQHDGRSAQRLRVGSDAGGARGRHRGQARREVQANVRDVAGTWKDLTDSVNLMANEPHRPGAQHRGGHHRGGQRRPHQDHYGRCARRDPGAAKITINTMVDQLNAFASEVTRMAREVGTEGKLPAARRRSKGVAGTWKRPDRQRQPDGLEPDRAGAQHRGGHHRGGERRPLQEDHGRRQGREILQLKNTINTMMDQLNAFASEVTRVARRGRHRGQARRPGGRQGEWPEPGRI